MESVRCMAAAGSVDWMSKGKGPVIVAEIGSAHGGDIGKAKELVDASYEGGADAVKTQVIVAREILPPEAGLVLLPGGEVPLYSVFESLEREDEFYIELCGYVEGKGLGFFASPFGVEGFSLLNRMGVGAFKIASPELNHEPLLNCVGGTGRPVILSTGMAEMDDIWSAFRSLAPVLPWLLHCVTTYPAPENMANLRVIQTMKEIFSVPVGFSDHSVHPYFLPVLAMSQGACMIEKHLTLDQTGKGLDDAIALSPSGFSLMSETIAGYSGLSEQEMIKGLSREFGEERISSALGDGVKRPAECESDNRVRTVRSLHAVGALSAGTVVTEHNTALLRTEKVLRVGVLPRERGFIYGRELVRDVCSGDGITWEDVGGRDLEGKV